MQKTLSTPPAPIAHRTARWPRNKLTSSPDSSTKGAWCIQCWASLPIAPVVLWHHPSRNSLNRCRSQRDAAFRCTRTSLGMKNIGVFFSKKMGLQNGRTFLLRMMNLKEGTMNFGSIVCHFSPPRPFGFVAHSWTQKHRESGRHGRVVMVGKLRWRTSHSKMCWKTKKIAAVLWKQSSMFTNSSLISLHFICSTSLRRVGQHDVCQCAKNHLMQQETQKPHEIHTLRTNSQKLIAKPCKGWTILPKISLETSTATPAEIDAHRLSMFCAGVFPHRTWSKNIFGNLLMMAVLSGGTCRCH